MKAKATANAARASKAQKRSVMKAKRVSKIARGRMAKVLVLRGRKERTVGGLRQDALIKNFRGKVVSKRASAHGKRMYRHIEPWSISVTQARQSLHVTGFVAVNGRSLAGKALYVKSKALYSVNAASIS